MTTNTLPPGTKIEMPGVKDAVVVGFLKKATKKHAALYQIEYTVDDELERANPTGRRYSQPRYENQFKTI